MDSATTRLAEQWDARIADSVRIDSAYDKLAKDTSSHLWHEAASQSAAFHLPADSLVSLFRNYNHVIQKKSPGVFPDFAIGATSFAIERYGVHATPDDYYLATLSLYSKGYDDSQVRGEIDETARSFARLRKEARATSVR